MKKSLVAVGVIVAIGAVWCGASWYTGSKVESELNYMIEDTNSFIKVNAPSSGLQFKVENFKRGLFSSQANIVISSVYSTGPEESLVFNTDIEHGPFPLSQLSIMTNCYIEQPRSRKQIALLMGKYRVLNYPLTALDRLDLSIQSSCLRAMFHVRSSPSHQWLVLK